MSYVEVSKNLFVVEQRVKNDKVIEKRNPVNHMWVYDRSGSMWSLLGELTDQLITLSRQIPKGDTLSIGWFSGKGQCNFILKGFKISDDSDYTVLEKAIRNNSSTVGLTCFSEILNETKTVIEDLSVFSDTFSLHFFTDGYPNMDTNNQIFDAISGIKGKITSAMLVGYGSYYNKELMTKMAEKLGAMLIHSSMVPDYSESITRLIAQSGSASPRQKVLPPVDNPLAVFTVTDQGVVITSVDDDTGFVSIVPHGARTSVFYVTDEAPEGQLATEADDEDILPAMYAASLVLTQQMKTDLALEIMGAVGDKRMVDVISNSYTIDEYGRTEQRLEESIFLDEARFVNGKDTNYLPHTDAFCVFDVLTRLMNDDDSSFYPYHSGFIYNKVSKPTAVNTDYAKFVPMENAECAMDDLVWHKNRLNLSVRATINGSIDLKDVDDVKPSDVGLTDNYPVFVYRNYTFVKDGVINVKKFYVSTSMDTKKYFMDNGIVIDDGDDFDCDGIYGLDISNLPAINRSIADGNTSATSLCKAIKRDMELSGEIKALKDFLKNDFDDSSSFEFKLISDQQKEFLTHNGVDVEKGGVYNPKVDAVESTDLYIAKKFDVKIKGLSSIPAVKKVMDKISSGKNRTLSESVVEVGIVSYEGYQIKETDDDMRKLWLTKEIARIKKEQKWLRTEIQRTKFAILLSKKWFDEFDSRDQNTIDHDGWTFTFVVSEEAVKI